MIQTHQRFPHNETTTARFLDNPHSLFMSKPKKIINDPTEAVDELIEGLLLQYPNSLAKLQNHHVLLKQNISDAVNDGKVQILSGGGSGHEPSHAGWIGTGMLSGAILGGIFASPSVSSILAAIRAASKSSTCNTNNTTTGTRRPVLLIVKNYTGDRLNFGMACERANAEGIECQTVVVADDCALERTKGITGARGVAGTVLVHKIAGAAAAKGMTIHEVAAIANLSATRMGTLGVAIDAVTVPGVDKVNDRLNAETIEIGLGIHGEAGMRQSSLLTSNEMAKQMVATIQNYGREEGNDIVPLFHSGDELCLLLNNLGGTSNFEMSILARSVVSLLEGSEYKCFVTRVLVGSYMTAFDMHGASITILPLTDTPQLAELLNAETKALAWGTSEVWDRTAPRNSFMAVPEVLVENSATSSLTKLGHVALPPVDIANFPCLASIMIRASAKALAQAEPLLTKYDTICGDGDCGITMKRGATQVLEQLENETLQLDHPVTLFSSLADAISASMGGTSGVLIELMFRKISSSLARCPTASIGPNEMCHAIQVGVDAVSLYGGATVGSRTMLDALVPAAAALKKTGNIVDASSKARLGADGTAFMKTASAGRSNYLSEDTLTGTPDPGAIAVSIVLEAISIVLV